MSADTITNESQASTLEPKLKVLVIDTNAIVNGMSLHNVAERYYTCPEVIAEIRSTHSREFLARLPFEIKIENPAEDSLKSVIEFSKKTGDYAALSGPDLKVIALAHMLEIRENGPGRIRSEPIKPRPTGQLPTAPPPGTRSRSLAECKKSTVEEDDDQDGWEEVSGRKGFKSKTRQTSSLSTAKETTNSTGVQTPAQDDITVEPITPTSLNSDAEPLSENVGSENPVETADMGVVDVGTITDQVRDVSLAENVSDHDDDEDSDGGEWITPENLLDVQARELSDNTDSLHQEENLTVACVTGDFAMQNVILQMNLNLVSPTGQKITKVKNWVLRCHACYTVTSNMEKKFCPKCGSPTLSRVSCNTDSKGRVVYYLKKNFQHNLRGTKYAIPTPKGGRVHNNIVLREDQREYVKAQRTKHKQKIVDMFDPDFIPLHNKLDTRITNNNMHGSDVIGFGRKNPNFARRRI